MGLEKIKSGMAVTVILKAGTMAIGIIGLKYTVESENRIVSVIRLQLTNDKYIDISEDDIELVTCFGDKEDKLLLVCPELEKYGLEAGMNAREVINYFICTWMQYSDEEKLNISIRLFSLLNADIFRDLLQVISDWDKNIKAYHENCQKQLKSYGDALIYKLDKDYKSIEAPLLKPEI